MMSATPSCAACGGAPQPSSSDYMARRIILIRHGESEGNVDWRVMATVPDHKLALTEKGRRDGFDAGRKLKGMIGKNDRVRFYVSPYLRARQTLDEILKSFRKPNTAADGSDDSDSTNLDDADPPLEVPFDVKEEPRLREQDWGNFQNFEQMELIKAERAAYGPFYYRIPHGESGADVHDRVSIFLDSLVRTQKRAWPLQPTVIVIVTHGLLARLFAMRFMRLSVDEFESWRNLKNGEHIVIDRLPHPPHPPTFPPAAPSTYRLTVPPHKRSESPSKKAVDDQRRELVRRMTLTRRNTVDGIEERRLMLAAAAKMGILSQGEEEDGE